MGPNTQGPESLAGRVVAGYRLERMLGMGATGAVFLGTRLPETPASIERTGDLPIELPDEAAIKLLILPWQLKAEEREDFRARFLREGRTLQRLRHPHILSVLTYGDDLAAGFTYMVLPYMRGGTLSTRLAEQAGPLPFAEVTRYLGQIASALDYAHSQGVVHRDIKPANILLDDQGQAYLADFSIVRLVSETTTRLTTTGRVMGTPAYMAPEQIAGIGVGQESDIYALGMVLYEMVTGTVAFDAPTLIELIRQHAQDVPPPPRTQRRDLPEPAEAAILRALAKRPEQRFPAAGELVGAFDDGLRGRWAAGLTAFVPGAMLAQPPNGSTFPGGGQSRWPVRRLQERRSGGSWAAALLAVALVLSGTLVLLAKNGVDLRNLAGGPAAQVSPQASATHPAASGGPGSPTSPPPTVTAPGQPQQVQPTQPPAPGAPTATPGATGATGATTPTDTPVPTDTPIPPTPTPIPPTPTATPCPYLNGGTGVTFYSGTNFTGQAYNVNPGPGQDIHFNLPSGIAGNLNSMRDGNFAFHIVTFNNPNSTGNLAHWDGDVLVMPPGPGQQNSASAEVYLRRSC